MFMLGAGSRCWLLPLRSRMLRGFGSAMFNSHVGGSVASGVFCCNIRGGQRCQGRVVAPESQSCTVAILAQGTSWAVAVTQAFLCAVVVVDSVMRAGVVCGLTPRAAAGGAQLARTHVSPFLVAPCVCRPCSVPVLWCGGLAAAFCLVSRRCGIVGSRSQAGCLKRNTAMDDSIGGS